LAFIVFISVSAEIQVNEFLYQSQQRAGKKKKERKIDR